ncbi:unnamed protein product, partial [Lactuca virosa]
MASSASSSSVQKIFKYHVFLSFSGEDTRKTFVDHLYASLTRQGIHTFKDSEELEKGKKVDELFKAIEESKLFIIVFSKNYASSSWCLKEVAKIMECQDSIEQIAYPLFYDVEPTDVRGQSGPVGAAFAKHNTSEQAGKWKEALKEAGNLVGWDLKEIANGHEAEAIDQIVGEVSLKLRAIRLSNDENLIGMESRMRDLESSLEIGLNNDVIMIGIKGMGGIGKTTLAKAIFDKVSFQFEGISFVENVREASKTPRGLLSLQQQVLSDVLKDGNKHNSHDGKFMMETRLRFKKVLLVLDDVDRKEQLEELAGALNWFKDGSRIIITTRDKQVLKAHSVNRIYDVNLLSKEEAISLFNRYAFGRYAPMQSLEDDHKEIFLDVACFMKGLQKEDAIRILESCGLHAIYGLSVLEQKSLITISNQRLAMHDSIEELGRNLVQRTHPRKPNKHSRLWDREEIEVLLYEDMGTKATTCIRLEQVELRPEIVMKGLRNLKKLRVLLVSERENECSPSDWKFDQAKQYFSNALQFLSWEGYPLRSLPQTFRANNLVGLELPRSRITNLWESGDEKVLKKLRFLDLSYSKLRTLDLGLTCNLERLDLKGCHDLKELHVPDGCLGKLVYLNLIGCSKFKKSFLIVKGLESLKLLSLSKLELTVELHESQRYSHDNLPKLRFTCIYSEEDPLPIGNGQKSVYLDLQPRKKLECLSGSICGLQHLRHLTLKGCIPEVPNDLDRLEYLAKLNLLSTDIKCLPDNICLLKHLRSFKLESCLLLEELPKDLGQLECLEKLSLLSTGIRRLPDSICMLKCLRSLKVKSCLLLEEVPEALGQLVCLEKLNLFSSRIRSLPGSICMLKHLKSLDLESCGLLEKLPEDLGQLECLEKLILKKCASLEDIPNSISYGSSIAICVNIRIQVETETSKIESSMRGVFD